MLISKIKSVHHEKHKTHRMDGDEDAIKALKILGIPN